MNYSIPISNIDKVEILKLVLNCWHVRNKPFPSSYPWVSFVNLNLSDKEHNFCVSETNTKVMREQPTGCSLGLITGYSLSRDLATITYVLKKVAEGAKEGEALIANVRSVKEPTLTCLSLGH